MSHPRIDSNCIVGTKYKVIGLESGTGFRLGDIVECIEDTLSICPWYKRVSDGFKVPWYSDELKLYVAKNVIGGNIL